MRLKNIAKGQREFGNRVEIQNVQRDMANDRMWHVIENYEIERGY